MDDKDEEILELLRNDGRASYTEIAEEVDVSEGTVRNRVESMKEEGIIEKFTVEVNRERNVQAFVSVTVSTDRDFDQILEEFPEDIDCFEIAGDIDLLVNISRDSSEEVNKIVDKIRAVDGVEDTKTYMVLSSR